MGKRDDVWYATNIKIYDYVNAYNSLIFSADGKKVMNPTALQVWFETKDGKFTVLPGETLTL